MTLTLSLRREKEERNPLVKIHHWKCISSFFYFYQVMNFHQRISLFFFSSQAQSQSHHLCLFSFACHFENLNLNCWRMMTRVKSQRSQGVYPFLLLPFV